MVRYISLMGKLELSLLQLQTGTIHLTMGYIISWVSSIAELFDGTPHYNTWNSFMVKRNLPELFFCLALKPGTTVSAVKEFGNWDNMTVRQELFLRCTDMRSKKSPSVIRSQLKIKTFDCKKKKNVNTCHKYSRKNKMSRKSS